MLRMPSDEKSATTVPRRLSKSVHVWSKSLAYVANDACDDLQVSRATYSDDILFHDNVCMIRTNM